MNAQHSCKKNWLVKTLQCLCQQTEEAWQSVGGKGGAVPDRLRKLHIVPLTPTFDVEPQN